jgi:succinyl-CoA synthetase beta subunit
VVALDAKFNFDDNALYRQKDVVAMRDTTEEDPREVAASEFGLNYIGLDGNIACLVNGAGLAMSHHGHHQAARRRAGQLPRRRRWRHQGTGHGGLQDHPRRPEREGHPGEHLRRHHGLQHHRHGIVAAAQEVSLNIPLVVRLEGNNVDAGKATLAASGLAITSADGLTDAAQKIVAAVGKA